MIFANHNLNKALGDILYPDKDAAADTNSVANIRKQTDICVDKHGRNPNVVMVSRPTPLSMGCKTDDADRWTLSPRARLSRPSVS